MSVDIDRTVDLCRVAHHWNQGLNKKGESHLQKNTSQGLVFFSSDRLSH